MSVSFGFELGGKLDFSHIKLKRTNAKMNITRKVGGALKCKDHLKK
jgi:hypothetical protein